MTQQTVLMLLTVFAVLLIAAAFELRLQDRNKASIKSRQPLTLREQPMYFRLCDAAPERVVLAQVAFSALLTTRTLALRNTFDRKVADFVVCTKAFEVIAVIELDDSSHKGREAADAKRAQLLTNAGYTVLRYRNVPDTEVVRADLERAAAAKTSPVAK